ncbi:REP-associated tyrosine transposase [Spirosoma foliorum]|uniref:Transposase n=1 Tax=Spirosoma foliorum TaxID=2710596 RepID=A0A7G5GPP2_9BACT|nr:transposase [Spirosoma foliorum]QMW00834.1 transposase [Spirosoma foliorum]
MPPGETLFITYRLHGTVPFAILRQLQEEHDWLIQQNSREDESLEVAKKRLEGRYFVSFDQYIDTCRSGADWLKNEEIAELVKQSLHFGHTTHYHLHAYCVMPNHVHVLLTVLCEDMPFYKILQRLKTYTAVRANRLLNRTGQPFWQSESYDHAVRNEKSFKRIVNYILQNPVKAGLVTDWEDWPHSYCQYE